MGFLQRHDPIDEDADVEPGHLGGGSLARRAYALMKRLSDSDREAITPSPRCTSSRQSTGGGSLSMIAARLPAMDLIGASELFIS